MLLLPLQVPNNPSDHLESAAASLSGSARAVKLTRERGRLGVGHHDRRTTLSSVRRIEANRQNAQRSTGPKTAEGKARVAQNAMAHRLFSRQSLLPDEAPQELEDLRESLRADLSPEGPQEEVLVELMVDALWRRRRLGRVEAGIYSSQHYRILANRARREARRYEQSELTALEERLKSALDHRPGETPTGQAGRPADESSRQRTDGDLRVGVHRCGQRLHDLVPL